MVTFTFQIGEKKAKYKFACFVGYVCGKKVFTLAKSRKSKTKHGCKLIMSTDTAQKSGKN